MQIYEEDFKKERSDRERLNQEKETLQQIIQTSESQLNRLNSQVSVKTKIIFGGSCVFFFSLKNFKALASVN